MAFNVDTSVYNRIVPLGDVMQQQQDRAVKQRMLEQQMKTGDLAQQQAEAAIKEKNIKQAAMFMSPDTWQATRQVFVESGIPEASIPVDYNPQWAEQLQTGLGLKAKNSLTALMDPDKGPIILDKNSGQYMKAREAGQPLSQRIMPPQIQTQDVPPPTQYDIDRGMINKNTPDAAISGGQPTIDDLVTAGRGAQLPPQIPDTPLTNQPQMTQIPQPAPTGSLKADRDIATARGKAIIENQQRAAQPRTPDEQAKYQASYGKANLSFNEAKRTSQNMTKAAQEALKLLKSGQAGGWSSALGSRVPESAARALENQVGTIKANTLVKALNSMRAASPTGGAVGALSDKEGALLAALEGPLDTSDPQGLEETLNTIIRLAPEVLAEREAALGTQFPDLYKPTGDAAPEQSPVKRYKYNPATGELE